MKKNLVYCLLPLLAVWGCSKKDEKVTPATTLATPVVSDFTATITGQTPNAKLTLSNTSTGATSYVWSFDKGASQPSATGQTPTDITIEKAGNFKIVLKASNGTDTKEMTKTIVIAGNSPIVTFQDIEFGLTAADATYGRLFSLETGKIYKDSELNSTINPKLHLAFSSMGNTMYYFENPAIAAYKATGATVTKVNNYPTDKTSITLDDFSTMADDAKIAPLVINETEESFGNSSIPCIVWFETATGRKGVVKVKAVNSSRILVDIKVQKY